MKTWSGRGSEEEEEENRLKRETFEGGKRERERPGLFLFGVGRSCSTRVGGGGETIGIYILLSLPLSVLNFTQHTSWYRQKS